MTELVSRGASATRGDFAVLRRMATRWMDNDVYGHVNNVVYYSYFDTAVNGWLIEATGQDIRRLAQIGLVVETSCQYLSPISFPDELDIGVGLERLGHSSIIYRLGIFKRDAAVPSALGRFVHVYVDAASRQSTAVPVVIRRVLESLLAR